VKSAGPTELLSRLVERGERRRYPKGVVLITEGERNDTLFIILSGQVKTYSVDEREREIVYGVYGPGETIGEMALDGGPRSASVMTLEPTLCSVVSRKELLLHIEEHPEFALELLAKVIERARHATRTARSMALLDVYGRVVQLLEALATTRDDGSRIIVDRLTHAEIANRVGCSREMVSRLMKDLRAGRYLVDEGDAWVLPGKPLPARW
jgi:CRP/FNR family cyclic AMP-dependent transcriptional regulator